MRHRLTEGSPWLALVFLAVGCSDPAPSTGQERCTTFTDVIVTDTFESFRAIDSTGDEQRELWRYDKTSLTTTGIGHARQPDGNYVEQWRFDRDGDAAFGPDFDGDGRQDLRVFVGEGEDQELVYVPMGSNGVPVAEAIPIELLPDEAVLSWLDLDLDGRADRLGWADGQLWVTMASTGTSTALALDLASPPDVFAARGDEQIVYVEVSGGTSRLLRLEPGGASTELWSHEHDRFAVVRRSVLARDEHIALFALREATGSASGADEVVLVRLDPNGTELDERVIEPLVEGQAVLPDDFDGDGHLDLLVDRAMGDPWLRFGDALDEYTSAQPAPPQIDWSDVGPRGRHDLDGDGSTELMVALPMDDGRRQHTAIAWGPCD